MNIKYYYPSFFFLNELFGYGNRETVYKKRKEKVGDGSYETQQENIRPGIT